MQPDDSRGLVFVEVAKDGISRHLFQVVPVFSLSKYAVPERPGVISAFRRFSDLEYDLSRPHTFFLVLSVFPEFGLAGIWGNGIISGH